MNIKDIIFGAIYTENEKLKNYFPRYYEQLNDQKNHFWFPARVKTDKEDNVYMIDTYQFEMPYECQSDYVKMVEYLKLLGTPIDNSWIKNKVFDYYYSAAVKLNENNVEAFDIVANLEDCEVVSEDEVRYYDENDVVRRVLFWNYHRSGRGVCLKRKDAVLRYDLKIESLYYDALNSISELSIWDWKVNAVLDCEKEAIEHHAVYCNKNVAYLIKLHEYIEKANGDYREFKAKLQAELGIK